MSKRRCTAEDTLLTFWPPAPCARIALSSISDSGIAIGVEDPAIASILPSPGRPAGGDLGAGPAACAPRPRPLTSIGLPEVPNRRSHERGSIPAQTALPGSQAALRNSRAAVVAAHPLRVRPDSRRARLGQDLPRRRGD